MSKTESFFLCNFIISHTEGIFIPLNLFCLTKALNNIPYIRHSTTEVHPQVPKLQVNSAKPLTKQSLKSNNESHRLTLISQFSQNVPSGALKHSSKIKKEEEEKEII